MFPFVFKLWRYHGLPGVEDLRAVSDVQPPPPVAPALNVTAADAALAGEKAVLAESLRGAEEPLLPRLWGSRTVTLEEAPRTILAVDDGSDAAPAAIAAAQFLARSWGSAVLESPVFTSHERVLTFAEEQGADWIVAGLPFAALVAKSSFRPVISVPGPSFQDGLRRILIPVDGTPATLPAVSEGLAWAKRFGSELLLLHVRESGGEESHRSLLDLLQRANWRSVAHENVEAEGGVSCAILDCARKTHADLILMATHLQPIQGALLPAGPTLEVLASTTIPVMTHALRHQ